MAVSALLAAALPLTAQSRAAHGAAAVLVTVVGASEESAIVGATTPVVAGVTERWIELSATVRARPVAGYRLVVHAAASAASSAPLWVRGRSGQFSDVLAGPVEVAVGGAGGTVEIEVRYRVARNQAEGAQRIILPVGYTLQPAFSMGAAELASR